MEASGAPAAAPAPVAPAPSAAPARPAGGVDTTRVLALFGYVGPVASLMTHTLFPGGSAGSGAGRVQIQRMGGVGAADGGRAPPARVPSGLTPGKTRFVLSRTEDAMDSVLPCAAERMFHRPGRFANASALRFNYQA
jgi:hypothetical protein